MGARGGGESAERMMGAGKALDEVTGKEGPQRIVNGLDPTASWAMLFIVSSETLIASPPP